MAEILALDDVMDAAHLIRRILERKGHRVHAFCEENEAIAFARHNPLDLAILDVRLRAMTGLRVLEEIKAVHPELRSIILTGYPSEETEERARVLGVNAYCAKPVDKEELEEKVRTVLEGQGDQELRVEMKQSAPKS